VDDVIIQDIGTAFNVKALPGSNVVEVLVESGEVRFFTASNEGVTLVKGEKASYDKTTRMFTKIEPLPAENTLSYKSKVFYFKGTPLREVVRQINEIYESNVQLGNPALGNCLLSTSFDNMQLEDVVDIIADTFDFQVERTGGKIVLKGQPCVE
jgi:ferric-dicitrate binding protein FerR (iron transport regulator)